MQEFRRFVRGPMGKVLLVAIILPFVISAFYGYFTGGQQDNAVAEVNGTPINKRTLDARVRQYRQRMSEQRPELDSSMLEEFINPSMVLQGLVNNQLIYSYAQDASMAVADQQTAQRIRNSETFQNEQGEFSRERFERMVRNAGMNPSAYMNNLRRDILGNQVRSGIQDTAFALPRELATQRRLGEQTRDLRYLVTRPDSLVEGYRVEEATVREYYENNSDEFMRPPRFQLAWVELTPKQYKDRINITEDEIRQEYEARKQTGSLQPGSAQGRQAAHILLKTGDQRGEEAALSRAMKLRQRIVGDGTSFAEAARRNSEDAATADQGGDLGRVGRGDLPDSMTEALFALQPGAVSEPVVTDSGVHLVKRVQGDQGGETPGFEEKRDEIAESLREGKVKALLSEEASRLDQLAYEHTDLKTPAEKLDLEIRTTGWFTLENPEGIATNPAVREAMQTKEVRQEGQNSKLLELGDQRRAVIRLAGQKPEEPRPLTEVADRIRQKIKRERARAELDERADRARQALEQDQSLEGIAADLDLVARTAKNVKRGARQPEAKLVQEAFAMPRPGEGVSGPELVRLADGGLAVLTVTEVTDGDPAGLSEQQQRQALGQLGQQNGRQSLRSLIAWLRAEGEVDIKEGELKDVSESEAPSQEGPSEGGPPEGGPAPQQGPAMPGQ
jgi:peptidyl-prolyl cis-trans isomerase D